MAELYSIGELLSRHFSTTISEIDRESSLEEINKISKRFIVAMSNKMFKINQINDLSKLFGVGPIAPKRTLEFFLVFINIKNLIVDAGANTNSNDEKIKSLNKRLTWLSEDPLFMKRMEEITNLALIASIFSAENIELASIIENRVKNQFALGVMENT